jgi:hypothetical protein
MYANHNYRLESPPPRSQFRRPWSPDPYEPYHPVQNAENASTNAHGDYWDPVQAERPQYYQRHRDPSDISVEALDLADYSRTLRAHRTADNPYPPFSHELNPPISIRNLLHPPSTSGTLSTQSHAHSSTSRTSRASRRPFSLPPPALHSGPRLNQSYNSPLIAHSPPPPQAEPEIDISQFPPWSRGWYDSKNAKDPSPSPQDDYPFPPKSLTDPQHRSLFDPSFPTLAHSFPSDVHPYPAISSHDSTRDVLPWSGGPPDHGLPIDPATKEERIRMLQREFGPRANRKDGENPYVGPDGRPFVGSVDQSGNLVTEGPKKRVATRILQLVLALAAAIPSIYAAVVRASSALCLLFIATR